MKKFIPILLLILLLSFIGEVSAANKFYWATGLISGAGALNTINGTGLVDGDMAIVGYDNSGTYEFYAYRLEDHASNPPDQDSPSIITPTNSADNKRWHLLKVYASSFSGAPDVTTANTWTGANIFKGGLTVQTTEGVPIFIFPSAAPVSVSQMFTVGTNGVIEYVDTPVGCILGGLDGDALGCLGGSSIWTLIQSTVAGGTTISNGQFLCGEVNEETGEWTEVSCGTPVIDHSSASHLLCKDSDGEVENCILVGLLLSGTTGPTISVVGVISSAADVGTTAGYVKHDSDDTAGNSGGALEWYDGAQIRTLIDTGTNYTIITKTEYLPIRYAEDGTSAPAAAAEISTTTAIGRGFDKDADEDVVFWWITPNDYVGGIKYRVIYALAADATADDTAVFQLAGCAVADSAALGCTPGDPVALSDELTTDDDQFQLKISDYSTEVTVTSIAAGSVNRLVFNRDVSADDYTEGDLLVVGIEIKYKAKIIGVAGY